MSYITNKQDGFTLVEIAIVLGSSAFCWVGFLKAKN
jgi:hypothetical protein